MLASLSGDFSNERLMFQPEAEDVAGRVDIPVVGCATVRTNPTSYSKRAYTFRAAIRDYPAARTRLGTVSFVGFDKHGSVPSGLVAEHMSERCPTRIVNGFCHPCLCEAAGVHIADDDQTVFASDLGGLLVEMMTARVCDLCAYRLYAFGISGPLSDGKAVFIFPVVARVPDLLPVTERSEVLQAEIDSDVTLAERQVFCNPALEDNIPASPCVFDKMAGAVLAIKFSGLPEAESTLEVNCCISVYANCTRDKGHPPEGSFRTKTGAESWTPTMKVTRFCELPAYLPNSVRMKPKLCGATGGQSDKVKGCRPAHVPAALAPTLGLALGGDAKIPDLVARNSVTAQMPIITPNAVFEADYAHGSRSRILFVKENIVNRRTG